MHHLEKLDIWKKAMALTKATYRFVASLPKEEKFGLVSQLKRCSVSIPSNIAEGAGRNSNKEFAHFLSIANGSCYELKTQLLTVELKIAKTTDVDSIILAIDEIQKMNYALQKRLKQK